VPGFGDQRNIELLVEAGFSLAEAIRIATLNGTIYMGRDASIGSIASGKAADLVVLDGNPAEKIENIENVDLVFKDNVGFDPAKLIQSATGLVGARRGARFEVDPVSCDEQRDNRDRRRFCRAGSLMRASKGDQLSKNRHFTN